MKTEIMYLDMIFKEQINIVSKLQDFKICFLYVKTSVFKVEAEMSS